MRARSTGGMFEVAARRNWYEVPVLERLLEGQSFPVYGAYDDPDADSCFLRDWEPVGRALRHVLEGDRRGRTWVFGGVRTTQLVLDRDGGGARTELLPDFLLKHRRGDGPEVRIATSHVVWPVARTSLTYHGHVMMAHGLEMRRTFRQSLAEARRRLRERGVL